VSPVRAALVHDVAEESRCRTSCHFESHTPSWADVCAVILPAIEIGAVKIRNHQFVDEWHSLVNPQRAIPAKITQITGITNEMVCDAPIFAEAADSFMRFMGDGIFVAHNVNFDYGFISYDFERLERRFRFPKLCTVAGMRRRYPGHKSYGLGKLCELYGIELETHRRALCDARATGHLLNLMNLIGACVLQKTSTPESLMTLPHRP
jgi:DNA polymerase III epsilon subunit family exonuclease